MQAVRHLLDTYDPDGKDFSGVGLWASEWQTGHWGLDIVLYLRLTATGDTP
jgi:hypothetical protein